MKGNPAASVEDHTEYHGNDGLREARSPPPVSLTKRLFLSSPPHLSAPSGMASRLNGPVTAKGKSRHRLKVHQPDNSDISRESIDLGSLR